MAPGWPLENVVRRGTLRRTHPIVSEPVEYSIEEQDGQLTIEVNDDRLEVEIFQEDSASGWCRWQGRLFPFAYELVGEEVHVWLDGTSFVFDSGARRGSRPARRPESRSGSNFSAAPTSDYNNRTVITPISGLVLEVSVGAGDTILAGDEICLIEAMKMEHSIRSKAGGVVGEVLVSENQQVSAGDVLVSFLDI